MKHFVNLTENVVTEALDGLLRTSHPGTLARLDTYPDIKIVLRADWDKSKVAIISGGGAGHEPSHAGFVGAHMLTAAVSGEIFASPSVEAVLTAIRAVTGTSGCLLIVKNYTGDRLNFGLAAEKARSEGFDVEMVIVADDVALPDIPQPRGVAGTLFVHKIAGHMAGNGKSLKEIHAAVTQVARDIASLGVSLSSCAIPGRASEERLGPEEGEIGLGIHGEPGIERIPLQELHAIVSTMADRIVPRLDTGEEYAVIINNLGAVPPIEMGVIANTLMSSPLAGHVSMIIGPAPLMTALNMNGFSLSFLRLDDARKAALMAPVGPMAWTPAVTAHQIEVMPAPQSPDAIVVEASSDAMTKAYLSAICERLIAMEAELNALDARIGDGDTGSTLSAGARALLADIDQLPLADPAALMTAIGARLATVMGGSSGVLLSIFFTAAGQEHARSGRVDKALLAGLERMMFYGGARAGDRTMIDALEPALKALAAADLAAAVKARTGADMTATMTRAKAGRSTYLAARDLEGIADPGAVAVAAVFEAARAATS